MDINVLTVTMWSDPDGGRRYRLTETDEGPSLETWVAVTAEQWAYTVALTPELHKHWLTRVGLVP